MRKTLLTITVLALALACGGEETGGRPNVLLIIIDTLRSDHIHCYGYPRDITPYMDSLAGAGTMWAFVQGQSAWTLPAIATIFSGLPERGHLAGAREGAMYGLAADLQTLPELLSEAGYATSGFYNVPVLGPGYGFDQGMDHVDVEGCRLAVDADVINDKFLRWIEEEYDRSRPFFSVLHYFDPHYPYDPPRPYRALFETDDSHPGTHWCTDPTELLINANKSGRLTDSDLQRMIDLYDGEVAFADHEVGRLMRELRSRGLADNTLVIVVADHGEEFWEHGGLLHGFSLYREATRVPLIISGKGFEGGVVDSNVVCQMDVFSTILDYAGVVGPEYAWGKSLRDHPSDRGRVFPSSGFASDAEHYLTVRKGMRRLFWDFEADTAVVFDLTVDPLEHDSLPADSALLEEVTYYWATPPAVQPAEVPGSQARINTLRNLGYIR
ncbi:sulfatase-like hydrolase/transferase [Candidatus Fermentibacteria bacterium]|nr:sulfatase-like hydrolase/transferase [Candidatus Fermentibacteria bacterium]